MVATRGHMTLAHGDSPDAPQARVGDRSRIPADAHGCPACPHVALGPAVAGSANVLVNGRPAVRINDPGIHAACCGPNIWNAKTGSRSVLINGRSAHREQDITSHCGGIGTTIEGSPNVMVGDLSDRIRKNNNAIEHNKNLIIRIKDGYDRSVEGIITHIYCSHLGKKTKKLNDGDVLTDLCASSELSFESPLENIEKY